MATPYKGYYIEGIILLKTNPGWNIKWQVSKDILNGREPIEAREISLDTEMTENQAIQFGMEEAMRYVDENL